MKQIVFVLSLFALAAPVYAQNGQLPRQNSSSTNVGGDLNGTQGAATVTRLQGRPLDSLAPTTFYSLVWDGSKWTPQAIVNSLLAGAGLQLDRNVGTPTISMPNVGPGAVTTGSSRQIVSGVLTDVQGRLSSLYALNSVVNIMDPRFSGGAKCDGTTDDAAAIQAAVDSCRDGKPCQVYVPGNPAGTACVVKSTILLHNAGGHTYHGIQIVGDGPGSSWIKAGVPLLGGGCQGVLCFEGAIAYDLKNTGIRDIRISGYDATTTGVAPVVSWAFTTGGFAIHTQVDTNGDAEAYYWNNPNSDTNCLAVNNYSTIIGGWGATVSGGRSAYNFNCNNAVAVGNVAYQVGSFVEHTGDGFVMVNNRFDYAGVQSGAVYQIGINLESPGGSSGTNGNGIFIGNTVSHAELAISVGIQSTGNIDISNNSIYNCDNGIVLNGGSTGTGVSPVRASNNTLKDTLSGSQGNAFQCAYGAGCVIVDNDIITGAVPWARVVYVSDATTPAVIARNRVWGNAVTSQIFYAAGTKVEFLHNKVIDWAGAIPGARIYYHWNGLDMTFSSFAGIASDEVVLSTAQRSIMLNTAAPTTGTWKVGDEMINTAPAAAGAYKWICTAGGTPGTWTTLTLN